MLNKNLEEQAATLFSENYFNRNYNVSKLEDIATIKYGKELPTKKLTPKGFPVFGGNGVIGKYIHFMYDEPQILVSCRGAASGNIIETYPNSFVTNNSLVLEWNDYRYYEFYKQFLFANPLHTYATGSAQPQITIDNIKNVPFPCPKYDEIRELCSQLKSISALHFENIVESNKLSMLRDTLLPKLISGELDVSNLDI
ncbi:restriction endonuclease subunit S [Lactobacillus iners]|uniref:restriction endonuclease subunit S n=1 Tax=Lactobacillus iners TaxID=147802 RepID=UPI0027E4897A|nr:restriction endonuclease subunit S [Lactobacillus iners]